MPNLIGGDHRRPDSFGERCRERRLSGTGQATDEGDADGAVLEVSNRHSQVADRIVGTGSLPLAVPHTVHLRPNQCAVGDVVVEKGLWCDVCCRGGVAREEVFRQVGATQELEVHCEKRDVVDDVDVTELVVEVEAVQHPGPSDRQKMSSVSRSA